MVKVWAPLNIDLSFHINLIADLMVFLNQIGIFQ